MWLISILFAVSIVLMLVAKTAMRVGFDPEGRGIKLAQAGWYMRWVAVAVFAVACALSAKEAAAQVIQGQVSPGTYVPVAVDASGVVQVSGGGTTGSASGSPISGNPTRVGFRAVTANYATLTTGSTADGISTVVGAQITKPYSIPEFDWLFATAAGGITTSADTTMAFSAVGVKYYVTGCSFSNVSATVATEVVIKDGSSIVLWRGYLPVSTPTFAVTFPSPLKGSLNTNSTVAAITTGAQVYVNCQGYKAP